VPSPSVLVVLTDRAALDRFCVVVAVPRITISSQSTNSAFELTLALKRTLTFATLGSVYVCRVHAVAADAPALRCSCVQFVPPFVEYSTSS